MTEKERLIELLTKYFEVGDSDFYICNRVKEAFNLGTMTLDDFTEIDEENTVDIADYLLKNNIVALPCKVGDTVYQYGKRYTKCTPYGYIPKPPEDSMRIGCCSECDSKPYDFLHEGTVVDFSYNGKDIKVGVNWENKFDTSSYVIGKDVFLTKEEAEKSKKR